MKTESDAISLDLNSGDLGAQMLVAQAQAEIIPPDRAEWSEKITAAWREGFEAILKTGQMLIDAKADLQHGDYIAMISRDLPFGRRTAHRLAAIAADSKISNGTHASHLPPSWMTLYELTRLTPEAFEAKIADGSINPGIERKDVASWNRVASRERDQLRVQELAPRPGKYRTIIIDPPWDYGDLSIAGRAAPLYATMTHEELLALTPQMMEWAEDNCHLYLWATNNFVLRAGELMAAWGFSYKTMLTWIKPRIGLGSYFRNSTEQILFGVRGELRTRSDSIPTHFEAPVGDHSEKPDRFYEIVVEASYGPGGEIFQRKERQEFINLYQQKADK